MFLLAGVAKVRGGNEVGGVSRAGVKWRYIVRMARALKTFRTTIGFFEVAVAAPSMKAALEIWGIKSNMFQQGFAQETRDPEIIRVTMAKPGVVLRRAVGSHGAFTENPDLPSAAALAKAMPPPPVAKPEAPKRKAESPKSDTETRKAAQLYDLAQKRRERDEARAQAEFEKEQERRDRAVEKAKAALEAARDRHHERLADIEKQHEALNREAQAEEERWESEKAKLDAALEKARS